MAATRKENDEGCKASLDHNQDDPKNAVELDRLDAKLTRLNHAAELLAAAMKQKPPRT